MNNSNPLNNVTGISDEKLTILRNLEAKVRDLPPEMAVAFIAKANSELVSRGLSFSQAELNYLLDTLTRTMPPAKAERIQIIRGMLNNNR